MQEELSYTITSDQLIPFSLSVKPINRKDQGCVAHYDVWYLVKMEDKIQFQYDPGKYHDTGWFTSKDGVNKVQHNPDFAKIISSLDVIS